VVLDYVNSCRPITDLVLEAGLELPIIQNVLWIADFFQLISLQKLCIEKYIVPSLTYDHVLPFLEDAFAKLCHCQQTL
jgi:hypothetical protein